MESTRQISIVVPTWNEEANIAPLVQRIDQALSASNIEYEIIFVDDHSKDNTLLAIKSLQKKYPLVIKLKKGKRGKAMSLIEGFTHTQYDLICMIDADLQYPPEALPDMIKKIDHGSDVVVANRKQKRTSFTRKLLSNGYSYFFGRVLHNFKCDVQSGLKVFKKEIIKRTTLNPTP